MDSVPSVTFTTPLADPGGLNAAFGASLAHGDINGDGLEDVVIGDPQADEAIADDLHGAAHVFLGEAGGFPGSPDQTLYGVTEWDYFGSDVSVLGDVNGDGFDDVAISAYVASDWSGKTSVYLGTPGGLEETPSRVFAGEYANAGVHGSAVGDVNGDGFADVMVTGIPDADHTAAQDLYLGGTNGFADTPDQTFDDPGTDNTGIYLYGAGDLNGDGYDDVIASDYAWEGYAGQAFVYNGSAGGLSTTPSGTLAGDGVFLGFGARFAAGDANGDGYGDLLVAALGDTDGYGAVYLFAGSPEGVGTSPQVTFVGEFPDARLGIGTAFAGDLNGDGMDEIVLQSNGADADTIAVRRGALHVYEGATAWPSTTASQVIGGATDWQFFGYPTSGAGDVNGDGRDDVLSSRIFDQAVDVLLGYSATGSSDTGDTADTAGSDEAAKGGGCACASPGGASTESTAWLALACLVVVRRTRRG